MSRPTRRPARWGPLGLVTLALAACGQAPPPSPTPGTPLRFSVDPALTPRPATLPPDLAGERPLVSARDERGRVSTFVGNEVILAPHDEAELAAFLARTGGTVIESNAVSGVPGQPGETGATEYTVRLDPAGTVPGTLVTDAAGLGLRGETTLSSEGARRLLALVAREVRAGTRLGLNLVFDPAGEMLPGTGEAAGACGSPTANAFDCAVFQATGSRASVTQAWQFLAAHGITRRVRVAIIDSGFWLDQNNVPDPSADLPPILDAHDFHNGDGTAGGESTKCEGQKAGQPGCLWHGHNSASVAMGVLNNGLGVAGTGGQVADALLYKWGFTKSSLRAAVARARVAGADVISMSVRGTCNDVCAKLNGLTDEFALAVEAGIVPVAAAGNDGQDVSDSIYPCTIPGVICVGALQDGGLTAFNVPGWWASNYGGNVDLWAPTNIPAMPIPGAALGANTASGTSAATPFVAGIAAMIKALNPTWKAGAVQSLLQQTAWKGTDDKVGAAVNAYEAVLDATGRTLPDDVLEPNDTPGGATPLSSGDLKTNLSASGDPDWFSFTLSDYAEVSLKLRYLGSLGAVLSTFQSTKPLAPPQGSVTWGDNGRTVNWALLPPGTYRTRVTPAGDLHSPPRRRPNLYDLGLTVTNKGLGPDAFEANDTLDTAAPLDPEAYTTRPATLHVAADMDHYRFTVTGQSAGDAPFGKFFRFRVASSDEPVAVQLFRQMGSGWAELPLDGAAQEGFGVPGNGTYAVRVKGTQRTRYWFNAGYVVKTPQQPSLELIPELVALLPQGDPGPFTMLGDLHWGVFAREHERYSALDVVGGGLHAALLDRTGRVVAEGRTLSGARETTERLLLTTLAPGEPYFLRLERRDLPPADVENALRPALSFSLTWQP